MSTQAPVRTIQAVFFDFGGVLQQYMDGIDHRAVEQALGLEERTLFKCLYRESRYVDYQVGKCTHEDWIDSIRAAADRIVPDKAEALMVAWQEAERPLNWDMIGLVRRLRAGNYRTGIISNTIPGMEARLQEADAAQPEERKLIPLFDVRICSGDLGVAKPDAAIYLHAAKSLGVDASACVFTDDVAGYAEAAREVGMQGFHFQGYDGFVANLRSIGVEC